MTAADGSAPRRVFAPGTTIDDLKAHMEPFAAHLGYKFNTESEFVDAVLESEMRSSTAMATSTVRVACGRAIPKRT